MDIIFDRNKAGDFFSVEIFHPQNPITQHIRMVAHLAFGKTGMYTLSTIDGSKTIMFFIEEVSSNNPNILLKEEYGPLDNNLWVFDLTRRKLLDRLNDYEKESIAMPSDEFKGTYYKLDSNKSFADNLQQLIEKGVL